jgi:hypothetical protein
VDDALRLIPATTKGGGFPEPCNTRGAATASPMMLLVSGSANLVGALAMSAPGLLGHALTPGNSNLPAFLRTGLPWMADNGCFHGLDAPAFRRMLARVNGQPGCLFVVVPDVVADARATLRLFGEWALECRTAGQPLAFVGQDGAEDLAPPWDDFDAYFVGGSTAWKLSRTSRDLMEEARQRGKHVHVGRVNTLRRLRWAFDSGADSVDGSIFSRMSDKFLRWGVAYLKRLHAQPTLFGRE